MTLHLALSLFLSVVVLTITPSAAYADPLICVDKGPTTVGPVWPVGTVTVDPPPVCVL